MEGDLEDAFGVVIMTIPKCELILHMIGKVATDSDRISVGKLQTIIYLLEEKEFKPRYKNTIGYKFDEFSLRGPYDEQLTNDLRAWMTLDFIENVDADPLYPLSNIRLSKEGEIYKKKVIEEELVYVFGSREELQHIKEKFKKYLVKPTEDIFTEAYNLWMEKHADKKQELEAFLKSH